MAMLCPRLGVRDISIRFLLTPPRPGVSGNSAAGLSAAALPPSSPLQVKPEEPWRHECARKSPVKAGINSQTRHDGGSARFGAAPPPSRQPGEGGKCIYFSDNWVFFNLLTRFQGFKTAKIPPGWVSGCLTGCNLLFSKQSTISGTAQNRHLQLSGGCFPPGSCLWSQEQQFPLPPSPPPKKKAPCWVIVLHTEVWGGVDAC